MVYSNTVVGRCYSEDAVLHFSVVVHRPTYPTLADVDEGLTEDIEERGLASTIDYNAVQTYPQRPTFEAKPLPLRYETQCETLSGQR